MLLRDVGGVDLDLVAVVDRRPGVVGGAGSPRRHRSCRRPADLPVELQGVRRRAPRPGTRACPCRRTDVSVPSSLERERARARLLPAVQRPVCRRRAACSRSPGGSRPRRAGRPPDAAEQVLPEGGVGVRLLGVAAAGVEGAAALVLLAPGDRVVAAHGAAGVRDLVERGQDVGLRRGGWCGSCTTRRCGPRLAPRCAVAGCAWSSTVDRGGLDRGVRLEVGARRGRRRTASRTRCRRRRGRPRSRRRRSMYPSKAVLLGRR